MKQDKVIIITGSSGGIGRETALQLLMKGYSVVINGRTREKLEHLIKEWNHSELHFVEADATTEEGIQRLVEESLKRFGKIDGLILNAGHSMRGRFEETTLPVWEDMVRSNLLGPARLVQKSLPHLRKTRGQCLFISTQGALFGFPNILPYGASKAGLLPLMEGLQQEEPLMNFGIFFPGFTQNDPGKKILNAQGEWVSHRRKASFSQKETARLIVKAYEKKRKYSVIGFQGKFLFLLRGLSPGFLGFLLGRLKKNLHKSKMKGK